MKREVVFISKFSSVKLDKRSDIILSPEFYWVIKRKLPVKTPREARKLCDSLFDGILPKGEYEYKVIKEDEFFYIFAYDSEFIIKTLKSIGLDLSKVNAIYLAQNELLKGIAYNFEDRAYIEQDGIFVSLPKNLVTNDTKDINEVEFTKLSGIKISLERYSSLIDKRTLNIIMSLTMIFITLTLFELFLYKKEYDTTVKTKELLYEKYNLPKTSWQINAIKEKVDKIFKKEIAIRDEIYAILKIPLKKGSFIKTLDVKSDSAKVWIKLSNEMEANRIKDRLLKSFEIDRAIVRDGVLKMELKYAKD